MSKTIALTCQPQYETKYLWKWGDDLLDVEAIESVVFKIPDIGENAAFWPYGGVYAGFHGIYLNDRDVDYCIESNDINVFKDMVQLASTVRRSDEKSLIRVQTYYMRGKWKRALNDKDKWELEDKTRDTHLTVIQLDIATGETVGFRHFIQDQPDITGFAFFDNSSLEERVYWERLENVVNSIFSNNIHHTVKFADKNIEQIKREREKLEDQQIKLQKKIAKLEELKRWFEEKEASKLQKSQRTDGYVYLLKALHDDRLYKIGRTSDPANRLKAFGVKLPFPVEYLCLIKCNDMYALEAELHRKFANSRIDGEWFALTSDDLLYFQSLQ